MVLTVHRVAEKFPRPSPERYAEMKASIEKYGVLEPVKVWNLCIMDGLTRHTICKELGIDCPMEHWDCDEADAIERAKAYNTARRDLTESQRVMAVVECDKLSAEALKARQKSGLKQGENREAIPVVSRDTTGKNSGNSPVSQKQENGRTRKKVAEQANVSEETAQRAIRVSSLGTEEVKRAVTDGKVTVKDAAKVVTLPAEKQNAALAKVESGEAKTLTAAAKEDKQETADLHWDRRGRLIFDDECLERHKAASELAEIAEEIDRLLKKRGVRRLEDLVLRRGENQGEYRKLRHILWTWKQHHPGMVCPVCFGTGQSSEERARLTLDAVERIKAGNIVEGLHDLQQIPTGEPCPYCSGSKWTLGLETEKTVEDMVFAMHAPYRKDARKHKEAS